MCDNGNVVCAHLGVIISLQADGTAMVFFGVEFHKRFILLIWVITVGTRRAIGKTLTGNRSAVSLRVTREPLPQQGRGQTVDFGEL